MAKLSVFVFICATLTALSYHSTSEATTLTGPTEISSQEFKELNINGPSNLNEIKADSLTVRGPLNFNQLKVKGDTEISGPTSGESGDFANVTIHGTFWGSKIKLKDLRVDGEVTIEDFKISGNVNINGPLKAKNGSFNDINTVYTPIALYNVKVNNIDIKTENAKARNEDINTIKTTNSDTSDKNSDKNNEINNEIKLAGDTIVSGNITFESGNGVVFIRDKTAQLKGKVIGGTIREN